MPAKRKNTRKRTNNKKKANPSLNLVLKRLDKFDKRFDVLDRKIDAVGQKVDVVRQETAAEIQSVRNDMVKYYSQLDRKIDENEIDKLKAA